MANCFIDRLINPETGNSCIDSLNKSRELFCMFFWHDTALKTHLYSLFKPIFNTAYCSHFTTEANFSNN